MRGVLVPGGHIPMQPNRTTRSPKGAPSEPAIGAPSQEQHRGRTPEALENDLTAAGYDYLKARGITDEVIDAAGIRWLRAGKGADTAGEYGFPQRAYGLFLPTRPLLDRADLTRGVLRRFDVGAPRKFEGQRGKPNHLVTPPGFEAGLQVGRNYANIPDAAGEVNEHGYVVVEGVTRVLALASIGLASIGINGAWNWKGQNKREGGTTTLPDWEEVAIKGAPFAIALDGDVQTNDKVHQAGERLARWLTGRGATSVEFILLPPELGLDDWIAERRAAGFDAPAILQELAELRGPLPARPLAAAGRPWLYGGDSGELRDETLAKAWDALAAMNRPDGGEPVLFRADIVDGGAGRIARRSPTEPLRYEPVTAAAYQYLLVQCAAWYKTDNQGVWVKHHPPRDLAELMTQSPPDRRLPRLERIYSHPVLVENGGGLELLTTPGFHDGPGVLLTDPAPPTLPPSADAAAMLADLLADIPFEEPADYAGAVAYALTLIVKRVVGETPAFQFDKPRFGTGATLLVKTLTMLATGSPPDPVGYPTGYGAEEEMSKTLTTHIMSGKDVLFFDNVQAAISSASLAQLLTADGTIWGRRLLGGNAAAGKKVSTVVVLTANQSSPTGEIARRSVRIRLLRRTPDPATYVPSEGWRHRLPFAARTFRGVLEAMILEWIAQGCPRGDYQHSTAPDWAQIVGGILDVAGIPGFLANAEALRGTVTGADALVPALVVHWWAAVEDRPLVAAAVREWFDAESVEQPWKLDDATPQGRGRQISEEMVKLVGQRHWLQDGRQVEVVTAEGRVDGKPKRAWRLVLVDDGEAPPPAPRTPPQNAEELRQRLEDG